MAIQRNPIALYVSVVLTDRKRACHGHRRRIVGTALAGLGVLMLAIAAAGAIGYIIFA